MAATRSEWLKELFPAGVPPLWCPPLTHYTREGALDQERIESHLQFLSTCVHGLLVPGTTGDGWELSEGEKHELMGIVLDKAAQLGQHVLWGALHPDSAATRRLIEEGVALLQQRTGRAHPRDALRAGGVCGFAVCPPRGEGMSQETMEAALRSVLDLGLPVALYQLPQVTQNEMSPALVSALAASYPHFILFKDTSGHDRVVQSDLDLHGVVMVRGMEGDYAHWLKVGGGRYDGFLLSTANSFGGALHEMRDALETGRTGHAQGLSDRLSRLVQDLFDIVKPAAGGNPFTNANKLADHFYAHGPQAEVLPPPRLHSGWGLTSDMVRAAGQALSRHDLMPAQGYLE